MACSTVGDEGGTSGGCVGGEGGGGGGGGGPISVATTCSAGSGGGGMNSCCWASRFSSPSLQSLDLIECDLQDDALREHIGPAVGKMTIPFDLYLDGNPITDDGLMQALGEGWLALDSLSLATCEKLTTGLHARLREVRRNLLPNLRLISLYMTALTPEDARAYLMQHIGGAYFKAAE